MHHLTVESFRRGVQTGVTSLAHRPCDQALTDDDLRGLEKAGCILEPTTSLAFHLSWPRNPEGAGRRIAELRESSHAALADEFWLPELATMAKRGVERAMQGKTTILGVIPLGRVFDYYAGIIGMGSANLRAMRDAGAVIACGNDAGAVPLTPAMLGLELECFSRVVDEGTGPRLSGAEALRMATLHSARALAVEKDFGTLEHGKVADLVVLDGDPLADYRLLGTRAAAVFMAGRLVSNSGRGAGTDD